MYKSILVRLRVLFLLPQLVHGAAEVVGLQPVLVVGPVRTVLLTQLVLQDHLFVHFPVPSLDHFFLHCDGPGCLVM